MLYMSISDERYRNKHFDTLCFTQGFNSRKKSFFETFPGIFFSYGVYKHSTKSGFFNFVQSRRKKQFFLERKLQSLSLIIKF